MKNESRARVIADACKAASDLLSQAAQLARAAAAHGQLNLARGVAFEAESCLATANKMMATATGVVELPPPAPDMADQGLRKGP